MGIFDWLFGEEEEIKPEKIYTKNGREGINHK